MSDTHNVNSARSVNFMSRSSFATKKAFLRAWDKFDIPVKFQFFIYKQWAAYYAKKNRFVAEDQCLDKALEQRPYDYQSTYNKHSCRRELADFEGALEYAITAEELNPNSASACIAVSQCLSDLSRYEDSKMALHRGLQRFQGLKRIPILEQMQCINSCLNDCLSPSWSPFIMRNQKIVDIVRENELLERNKDMRPLWKIQRDKGECDVLSEIEIPKRLMSPIMRARRLRRMRCVTQNYLGLAWQDMAFLKELTKDNNLYSFSMPKLSEYVKNNYNTASKFISVLHRKHPLYVRDEESGINPKLAEKFKEDFLYRVQYQTGRNVRSILRVVRQFRRDNKLAKLKKYVHEVVTNYLIYKTYRILPWKFEFTNEILNELGLAYLADYLKHETPSSRSSKALFKLLNLPESKYAFQPDQYVFGNREIYDAINFTQTHQEVDTSKIKHLKYILKFCQYDIIKTYLLHEIAYCNFENNAYDKCIKVAKSATRAAKDVGSNLWAFLCLILISKVYTVLQKFDYQLENLELCEYYARKLRNPQLIAFVENLQDNVKADMVGRKSTAHSRFKSSSTDSVRSSKSSKINSIDIGSINKYL